MRYFFLIVGGLTLLGCRQDMHDPPSYRVDAGTDFFGDRRAARPAIKGTVARNMMKSANPAYWTGIADGKVVDQLPVPFTKELLERGRDRYNIYCTPCHGYTGYGDGMIVSRGLKTPPSYHTEALRDAPIGHFFVVMTNGSGAMASYAARIPVKDRWAIATYVRALQQSQNVKVAGLTPDEMEKVNAGPATPAPPRKKEAAK